MKFEKKITLPRAGSGGSRQRGKVCREPPKSGSRQSGFRHLTVSAPYLSHSSRTHSHSRRREERRPARCAAAASLAVARAPSPPQPCKPALARPRPPRSAVRAAAAAPPEPRRRRSPASPPHPATSAHARLLFRSYSDSHEDRHRASPCGWRTHTDPSGGAR